MFMITYEKIIHKKRNARDQFALDSVNRCQNCSGAIRNSSVEMAPEHFCSVTSCKHPTHFYDSSEMEWVGMGHYWSMHIFFCLEMPLFKNVVSGTYVLAYYKHLVNNSSL